MKMYQVNDGSYALANVGGEMKPTSSKELGDRKFSILVSGCDLPASYNLPTKRNDTIIMDIKSGQIVFIKTRFLRELKYCSNCGYLINEEKG